MLLFCIWQSVSASSWAKLMCVAEVYITSWTKLFLVFVKSEPRGLCLEDVDIRTKWISVSLIMVARAVVQHNQVEILSHFPCFYAAAALLRVSFNCRKSFVWVALVVVFWMTVLFSHKHIPRSHQGTIYAVTFCAVSGKDCM